MSRVPDTQLDAFFDLQDSVHGKQMQVLRVVTSAGPARPDGTGGATSWEVARALGWEFNRTSGRFTELNRQGMIRDSGHRRINPKSGKRNIVWERTENLIPIPDSDPTPPKRADVYEGLFTRARDIIARASQMAYARSSHEEIYSFLERGLGELSRVDPSARNDSEPERPTSSDPREP